MYMWSEARAETYTDKIEAACLDILINPRIGRHYDNVPVMLWGYRMERHVIFYTILPDSILIVRILHVKMDFEKQIGNQP